MTKARTNADNVSGDISGVTAGTGLTGGGTSGTLTLDLTTPVATTNGGTGLSSFTTGDIIYSSSGNTLGKLGIGTTSQVLTVASGLPSWSTPSSGGMTLIQEQTASANSSLSFSSISGSYKQLLLTWAGIKHDSSGSQFGLRFNNNNSSVYNCGSIGNLDTNSNVYPSTQNEIVVYVSGVYRRPFGKDSNNAGASFWSRGSVLIDNYASTTKYKYFTCDYVCHDNADLQYFAGQVKGLFESTSAITSLDIFRVTGSTTFSSATNTSIRLYGIS